MYHVERTDVIQRGSNPRRQVSNAPMFYKPSLSLSVQAVAFSELVDSTLICLLCNTGSIILMHFLLLKHSEARKLAFIFHVSFIYSLAFFLCSGTKPAAASPVLCLLPEGNSVKETNNEEKSNSKEHSGDTGS